MAEQWGAFGIGADSKRGKMLEAGPEWQKDG